MRVSTIYIGFRSRVLSNRSASFVCVWVLTFALCNFYLPRFEGSGLRVADIGGPSLGVPKDPTITTLRYSIVGSQFGGSGLPYPNPHIS